MTQIEHMTLEAAEACRDNPELIMELDSQEMCDLNYEAEKRLIDGY